MRESNDEIAMNAFLNASKASNAQIQSLFDNYHAPFMHLFDRLLCHASDRTAHGHTA